MYVIYIINVYVYNQHVRLSCVFICVCCRIAAFSYLTTLHQLLWMSVLTAVYLLVLLKQGLAILYTFI